MKLRWDKFGGQLGIGYCVAGIVLIFLGWNGAASYDRVQAQIPYLISGGVAGLALVVLGAGLIIAQGQRADRAALTAELAELREALTRMGGVPDGAATAGAGGSGGGGGLAATSADDEVFAGQSAFHTPGCRLVEGQASVIAMTLEAARERGLTACRICSPA